MLERAAGRQQRLPATSRPAPAAPRPATGRRCSCACTRRWAERHGYQGRDRRRAAQRGGRHPQRHAAHRRRLRLRLPAEREPASIGWCASARSTANARRQTSFAAVDVMPEIDGTIEIEIRPDDLQPRHVPQRRPRRPAPEQDRERRALHALADRHRRREPHRAQPAQERRQRPEAAQGQAVPDRGAEAAGRGREAVRREGRGGLGQPDPQLRPAAVHAGQGRAHRAWRRPQVQNVLDGDIDEFIQAYLRRRRSQRHKKKSN